MKVLLREYISQSLLIEGPLDKMRNMGIPEEIGAWIIDFLPEYSKNHASWYAKEFANSFHQFKDYLKQYRVAKKKGKDPAFISTLFDKIKEVISNTSEDIRIVDEWAKKTNSNLTNKKKTKVLIGEKLETVPFDLASAVKTSKNYFKIQDGNVFMTLSNGWNWLDRETNFCSIEAKMMRHCGMADNSDSTLFSLRDPEGFPHVTVEVLIEEDGSTIYQVKGKANSSPDRKYWNSIFELLRNPDIQLKNYHAVGHHGGDLTWDMIPLDIREEIEEIHTDTFLNEKADKDIDAILTEASEEVEEAAENFSHDVFAIMVDSLSWESIDQSTAWIQVMVGGYIDVPEEIIEALSSLDSHDNWQRKSSQFVSDILSKHFNLYASEVQIDKSNISFDIEDEDLSSTVSIDSPSPDHLIQNFMYYESIDITSEEFLKILRNELISYGHIDSKQDQRVEDLDSKLKNVDIEISDDVSDDEFNVILASVNVLHGISSTEESKAIKDILYDGLMQEFFDKLVSTLSPNLSQVLLPNVDYGPVSLLSTPASAHLNIVGNTVVLYVSFHEDDPHYDEGVNFIFSVDRNIEKIEEMFTNMVKNALKSVNTPKNPNELQ